MGIRGIDISNHQATMDVERVVRENDIDFVIVQANDGTFRNKYFNSQIEAARRGGAIVAAYMYQRPNWQDTVDNFKSIASNDIPAIVDVEDGSGNVDITFNIHRDLWANGYRTPTLYLPKWYWDRIGQPSLVGLPPIWKSWYANNSPDSYENHLSKVPNSVWNGHGGLAVNILQFSGTGRLKGYSGNVDLNYFPGTREELINLFGQEVEEDMPNGIDLWTTRLKSGLGYEATAEEWVTETSARVERMEAQLSALTGALSDDEASIIAAIRGLVPGGPINDDQVRAQAVAISQILMQTLPKALRVELAKSWLDDGGSETR